MVRESNRRSIRRRSPRQARRRDAKRAEILRAAGRVFRRRGFAEAGMRAIATEADLSPANLYHYFRGKNELVYYCQDRALDQMLAAMTYARRLSGGATARLTYVLSAHATTLLDEVEGATAHVHVDTLPAPERQRLVAKRDRYERGVRSLLAEGVASGALVADDTAVVTRAMLGAINWTATWFRPDGSHDAKRVGELVARFLVRGVEGRPRVGAPRS